MSQLAEMANDEELAASSHGWRLISLIEMGDIQAADDEITAYGESAEKLQEPTYPILNFCLLSRILSITMTRKARRCVPYSISLNENIYIDEERRDV